LSCSIHDLRRTAASMMGSAGVDPFVISKILGHADPRGVTAIYDRSSWDADKRRAMLRWERHLLSVVSGQPASRVVRFSAT